MLSILFFIKRRKPLKDGSVPIFMRVSSHQEYVECSLRRSTMPSQWVTAKGRVRNNTLVNKQLNEYLDQQEFRIYDIERGLLAEGKQVSVQEVMRQYRGVEQPEGEMLCKLYEEHNSRMKELIGKTTAANTYKRHLTSLKLFREFLTATRGVSDIEVKALDAQLMEEYQHYLMTVRSNNNNTTVKYLRNLSKVVNLAKTRGLIQTNPIDLLPLKMQTVEREFLTQDELKRLEEKQIGISRLEQVRDIFLFCCLTGLAYVDVASLNMENIVEGKRGRQWLRKARNKTNNMCNIPGSGKSFAVVNNYIKQQIEKGYSMYIYDFKFSDLSTIAYNHMMNHQNGYKVKPQFYVINFDDPRRSHRCNPIHPDFMSDISDAYESAYTIMLNLNKTWVQKQGDFFVESPIILFAAIIWYLRIYKNGKFCTFPHAIELLNRRYEDVFPILTSYPELENYLSPFMDAWQGGAMEQLAGQIASAKIPLSRMISPQLYWVMSASEFTLDINNPEEPKILCVGNNPDRQNIYGAALGLYNSRIVKLINKKGQLKSSVIIDELPTIYFKGLDNLIATARSNKVAVCLGFQDFSQLVRDYGDKEAKVVINTVGNIFSGQVVGETAKTLSERFGKVLQKRQSISINRQDVSTSINTQMDSLIPPSKISGLTQGMFVGSVSDNFTERIEQKIFHAEIVVDTDKVKREESHYQPIPIINNFKDADGNDCMKQAIQDNYNQIKEDVKQIVKDELERIANDENLKHLIQK